VNDRYPLADVVAECVRYFELRRRKVFVEYVMLAGVNDRVGHARQLAELLDPKVFKVNLIPYNPIPSAGRGSASADPRPRAPLKDGAFDGSSRGAIEAFRATLANAGVPVTVRLTRGRDIAAACGQLAATG
jgi:23S rRNA (adenine2503-C2)-methyltransferase